MFKSILSVLGGTAIGVFTISFIQYLGHSLYPPPVIDLSQDPEAMASYLANAPIGALLLVLLGYAVGSFLGSMVAARYAPYRPVFHALLVGVLLMVFAIVNLWTLPHPTWFVIASLLVFLPMAFFGGNMSARRMP